MQPVYLMEILWTSGRIRTYFKPYQSGINNKKIAQGRGIYMPDSRQSIRAKKILLSSV
jgi:hypothetical protein